jgi:hypothetical protein
MKTLKFNWQIWVAFLLSVGAFLSYPVIFVRYPITRDFPWANLVLFAIAAALFFIGIRRAFAFDRPHPRLSKIAASLLTTLGVVILGFFVFSLFIIARWLPPSHGVPQVGQKAPEFTLSDINGKPVSLSELLTSPIESVSFAAASVPARSPKGVLLVFYRGYW